MKSIATLIGVFCILFLQAQNSFIKVYRLEQEFSAVSLMDAIYDDDTLVVCGTAIPIGTANRQGMFFAKIDTLGGLIYHRFYEDPDGGEFSTQQIAKMIKTTDGGYFFLGTELFSGFATCIKLGRYGKLEFYKKIDPAPDQQYIPRSAVEMENGYIIGGIKTMGGSSFNLNCFLLKIDKFGNFQWGRIYGLPQYVESMASLLKIDENHIIIGAAKGTDLSGGSPYPSNTFFRGYMLHVDSVGILLEEQESPNNKTAGIFGLERIPDGWLFGTAETYLIDPYTIGGEVSIARTGEDINDLKWELKFPNVGNFTDYVLEILPTPDNHWVALAVQTIVAHPSNPHPIFPYGTPLDVTTTMKFTSQGEMLWYRYDTIFTHPVFGTVDNFPGGLAVSPSGSIYVAGYANSYGYTPERSYALLLKITPEGCIDTLCGMATGLDEMFSEPVLESEIQVYPNPARTSTTIILRQHATDKKHLWVEINDVNGRVIAKGMMNSKRDEVYFTWDVSDIPNGIYYFKILNATEPLSGKIVVLK